MKLINFFSAALAAALLAGCASVENPVRRIPQQTPPLAASIASNVAIGTPAREWWRALQDPQLDALVSEAQQHNHEVQSALATLKSARAMADAATREALPQGSLDVQLQAQRPSSAEVDPYAQGLPRPPSSRVATLGQGLAWELDLFGRVGTATAVVNRRADSAAADLHAATALLQGEVVRHYTGLRLQQHTLRMLSEAAAAQTARTKLLEFRVTAGLADRREAFLNEAELRRWQVEAAQAEAALHAHLAALAVLCGHSPAAREAWHQALLAPAALPLVPADAALLQASDLLARRPDVARADAQLRAAIGEAVLAERAHLPRLSLNLALGLHAPFGQLGEPGAVRYAAGPALTWSWLDFGRIKARAAASRADQEAALHAFEHAVLKALQDSEVAVRQWAAARNALTALRQAERVAAQSAAHTRTRVELGLEPPTAALESNTAYLGMQRSVLAAQADALLAFGQVQLALGAWQPAVASETSR